MTVTQGDDILQQVEICPDQNCALTQVCKTQLLNEQINVSMKFTIPKVCAVKVCATHVSRGKTMPRLKCAKLKHVQLKYAEAKLCHN